jgi:hypothetical protein
VQAGLDPCWSQTHSVGFVMERCISILQLILNSESNGYLSAIADLEIMWNTCREMGNYWLVIQKSWLGGSAAKI